MTGVKLPCGQSYSWCQLQAALSGLHPFIHPLIRMLTGEMLLSFHRIRDVSIHHLFGILVTA